VYNRIEIKLRRDSMKSFMKKLFLGLFVVLIVLGGLNYKKIMLILGKGQVSLNNSDNAAKILSSNPNYVESNTITEGNKNILTTKSTDKTTDIKVISSGSKVENVEVSVDASKLSEDNIKDELIKNLEPVLAATTPDYKSIELWAAKEGAQKVLQSKSNNFTINQAFGDVVIQAQGDITTGQVKINIINNAK
jgi:hypothetical protein